MDNLVTITNLTKQYGKHTALDNLDLTIKPGQIVGLLGPNGAGKTTLIKTLTGLLTQYQGAVSICGHTPGPVANSLISYLPDKDHLPTWLTVTESIKFFADFYADFDTGKAQQMLHAMGIPLDRKLKHLSRGQREKVQLSLCMSRSAKLYILDEPIGAVDPASRDQIVETILKNHGKDSSVLISTHIISDVESILDQALFLKEGKVVLEGPADQIREEKGMSLDDLFREVFRHVS